MAEQLPPLTPAADRKGLVHQIRRQMRSKPFNKIEHELAQKSAFAAADMRDAI